MKKAFRIEEITEAVPNTNLQKRVDMVLFFGEEEIWRMSAIGHNTSSYVMFEAIRKITRKLYPFLAIWAGKGVGDFREITEEEHITTKIKIKITSKSPEKLSPILADFDKNVIFITEFNIVLEKALDLCGYKEPTIQKKCSCGKIAAKKDNFCSKCGEKL